MKTQTRLMVVTAVAAAALASLVPAGTAGSTQPLLRGISDFKAAGEGYGSAPLRRGTSDFILAGRQASRREQRPTVVATGTTGFVWKDAGIGAGITLGVVLLTGGIAGGIVFGRGGRKPLHDAN